MDFLLALANNKGARLSGAWPSTQLEFQNSALVPLPFLTTVEALNNAMSALSQGKSNPVQALSCCFQLNQSHWSRRARAKRSRSFIPKPPLALGMQVIAHLTRQCPAILLSGSLPLQRKLLLILSILLISHF